MAKRGQEEHTVDEDLYELDFMDETEDQKNMNSDFFRIRNQGSDEFRMNSYRNKLKDTLRKIQVPSKNQVSFLYKTLMPDYRQSNLISMRKREGRNLAQIRTGALDLKE